MPANARIGMVGQKLRMHTTGGDRTLFVEDMTLKPVDDRKLTFEG